MADTYIDASEMDKFAKKLAALPKQALPNAVRNTLNSAAFDVKTKTLPESGDKNFTNRSKNFFKANSAYIKATGFNMNVMHSTVGMSSDRLKDKSTNYAVRDLEAQEHGGTIGSKTFIPMNAARVGNNKNKIVRRSSGVKALSEEKFTPINHRSAKSRKQQFIRAAVYSLKSNGLVLGHRTKSGGRTLIKVDKITQSSKSSRLRFRFKAIYNVKKGRTVKITQPTHFMEEAANKTIKKIPRFFHEAAEFQFKKHLRI